MNSSRTLVISDLHLGKHDAADVLRHADARRPLLAERSPSATGSCSLAIVLSSGTARCARPRVAAEPLRQIGAALGPEGEVVITAGNDDHYLMHGWSDRRSATAPPASMGLDCGVESVAGEPVARLAELLSPARVRVAYPGVWLRDDVYAIHGHYLDLHLSVPTLERLGAALMRRIVDLDGGGPRVRRTTSWPSPRCTRRSTPSPSGPTRRAATRSTADPSAAGMP